MTRRGSLIVIGLILAASAQMGRPAVEVEGLWRYRTIAAGGHAEVPIAGLFVFKDGRFVQQSLNAGDPVERQIAQAHAGTYQLSGNAMRLTAQVGVVVDPTRQRPVESRRNSEHQLTVGRSGDQLTLTFGTGTVQKLERVGPGDGLVHSLVDGGALALVDGHFVLAAEIGPRVVAGSGKVERRGETLRMRPERWLSIRDGRPTYSRANVDATFDDHVLTMPGEPAIRIAK